jgi:hypothetical protein
VLLDDGDGNVFGLGQILKHDGQGLRYKVLKVGTPEEIGSLLVKRYGIVVGDQIRLISHADPKSNRLVEG